MNLELTQILAIKFMLHANCMAAFVMIKIVPPNMLGRQCFVLLLKLIVIAKICKEVAQS